MILSMQFKTFDRLRGSFQLDCVSTDPYRISICDFSNYTNRQISKYFRTQCFIFNDEKSFKPSFVSKLKRKI